MKRLLALIVALLLFALPALAEAMSPYDYNDDILEDGSPIYYFPELSIRLPADWQGKVMAVPGERDVSFHQIASYERYQAEGIDGGGLLFSLCAGEEADFANVPDCEHLGDSAATGLSYFLLRPTDYPAYPEDAVRAEYDAMLAGLDEVLQGVEFYDRSGFELVEGVDDPADIADDAAAAGDGAAAGRVSLARMRYHFEHSALPRYFYEVPENMLEVMGGPGAYALWVSLADENGVVYPYGPGDFAQRWYAVGGATILQIEMPAPEESPQCFRAYLVYDPQTGAAGYYTAEYDNLLGENALLCGWSAALEHVVYGGAAMVKKGSDGYEAALLEEAKQVAALAGLTGELTPAEPYGAKADAPEVDPNLAVIECPELGFSTVADPAYSWRYAEGTGITIYTEEEGRIPYVIVWQSEDRIMEPMEYIREQYTPHIRAQYGADLLDCEEIEDYDIGGKTLPAGLYTYRVQSATVQMLRLYDSTGPQTVAYTAKYIQGRGDATLAALDAAIRGFERK